MLDNRLVTFRQCHIGRRACVCLAPDMIEEAGVNSVCLGKRSIPGWSNLEMALIYGNIVIRIVPFFILP